jgi:hypothetical protein
MRRRFMAVSSSSGRRREWREVSDIGGSPNALFSGHLDPFSMPLQPVGDVANCPITRHFLWFLSRIKRDTIADLCNNGEGLLLETIKIISG